MCECKYGGLGVGWWGVHWAIGCLVSRTMCLTRCFEYACVYFWLEFGDYNLAGVLYVEPWGALSGKTMFYSKDHPRNRLWMLRVYPELALFIQHTMYHTQILPNHSWWLNHSFEKIRSIRQIGPFCSNHRGISKSLEKKKLKWATFKTCMTSHYTELKIHPIALIGS